MQKLCPQSESVKLHVGSDVLAGLHAVHNIYVLSIMIISHAGSCYNRVSLHPRRT